LRRWRTGIKTHGRGGRKLRPVKVQVERKGTTLGARKTCKGSRVILLEKMEHPVLEGKGTVWFGERETGSSTSVKTRRRGGMNNCRQKLVGGGGEG